MNTIIHTIRILLALLFLPHPHVWQGEAACCISRSYLAPRSTFMASFTEEDPAYQDPIAEWLPGAIEEIRGEPFDKVPDRETIEGFFSEDAWSRVPRSTVMMLNEGLEDDDCSVRILCIHVLSFLGLRAHLAIPSLLGLLGQFDDAEAGSSVPAAETLAYIDASSRTIPIIKKGLDGADRPKVTSAIIALDRSEVDFYTHFDLIWPVTSHPNDMIAREATSGGLINCIGMRARAVAKEDRFLEIFLKKLLPLMVASESFCEEVALFMVSATKRASHEGDAIGKIMYELFEECDEKMLIAVAAGDEAAVVDADNGTISSRYGEVTVLQDIGPEDLIHYELLPLIADMQGGAEYVKRLLVQIH